MTKKEKTKIFWEVWKEADLFFVIKLIDREVAYEAQHDICKTLKDWEKN